MEYRHVLAPLDLRQDSERVLRAAVAVAKRNSARLSVLHVVEYAPIDPGGDILLPTPLDITDKLTERAESELASLCERCGANGATRKVVVGSIKGEILQAATADKADLIVIGNHERHGLAILLNHTEDTLLHQAPCDILAIRLGKTQD
ncbi:MAG: universal stress protein [Nevskiales bacterium]